MADVTAAVSAVEGTEARLQWAEKRVGSKTVEVADADELSKKQWEVLELGLGGLGEEG